jgi:hypothetical protein
MLGGELTHQVTGDLPKRGIPKRLKLIHGSGKPEPRHGITLLLGNAGGEAPGLAWDGH